MPTLPPLSQVVLINFTPWVPWKDRAKLDIALDHPGIYIFAIFQKRPRRRGYALDKSVIYIGSTKSSLARRFRQFNRAAFGKGTTHTAGRQYKRRWDDEGEDLYVAVMPLTRMLSKKETMTYARRIERELLRRFKDEHRRLPLFNHLA